jgi:glycine cleavage system regulatory protein
MTTTSLVLTVIGPDRPGLIEAVAEVIAAHGGNWLESRMAHLAGKFAGVLRAEVPAERVHAAVEALARLEERGLRVVAEVASAGPVPPDRRPMELEVVGLDRAGIVREISQLLARHAVNVEDLRTDRTSAPMSGEMLFRAVALVHVPGTADLPALQAGLERLANELAVEIRLAEPGRSA